MLKWTHDEDIVLAEAVLRSIANDESLVTAFLEASKKLDRPMSACGIRWHHYLKYQFNSIL